MNRTAPLPDLDDQQPNWERGAALAREWELGNLADRLHALGQAILD